MNQSDYDFINVREYAIYFLRTCMITKLNHSVNDIPNIHEWERKTRNMETSFNDCLTINSSGIFECLPYTSETKSLQLAHNFLTYLQVFCKEVKKPDESTPPVIYIFLLLLIVSIPILCCIFYSIKSKPVKQHKITVYRGKIQDEYDSVCQLD